ncbi:unnamed protein product [Microthlaspi erraticum]|uniref:Uncharacterized protein n=1 Tax=Microthlaspi erraticum TaxID=1685480 RepID=A0A6D2I285_9BRAS|nr:unnamed protein product [Microthlaspi erraticum]
MTTTLRLLMRSFTAQASCGGRLAVSRRNFSSSAKTNREWHSKRERDLHEFWSEVITRSGAFVIGLFGIGDTDTAAEAKAEINEKKETYVRDSLEFLESGEKDTSESSEALLMNIKSKLGMEDNTDGMKDDVAYLKRAMEVLLQINRVDPVTLQPPLTRTEDVSSSPSPHS